MFIYKILNNIRLESFSNENIFINKKKKVISNDNKKKLDINLKSIKNKKIKDSLIKLIDSAKK